VLSYFTKLELGTKRFKNTALKGIRIHVARISFEVFSDETLKLISTHTYGSKIIFARLKVSDKMD